MVADHLGGIYECITDDEIALVPKTNVVREILPNLTGCFDKNQMLQHDLVYKQQNSKLAEIKD